MNTQNTQECKLTYTPGCWRVYQEPAIDYRPYQVVTDESRIAIMQSGGPNRAITRPEERANAYLISAAPNLLESCKEICRELDYAYGGYGHMPKMVARFYDRAKTAIAKAEAHT